MGGTALDITALKEAEDQVAANLDRETSSALLAYSGCGLRKMVTHTWIVRLYPEVSEPSRSPEHFFRYMRRLSFVLRSVQNSDRHK